MTDHQQKYWPTQAVSVNKNNPIELINNKPFEKKSQPLMEGFEFKTLTLRNLDDIHSLLLNHYIEDDEHIIRLAYSKDFLYWYLKLIPEGFIVGLIFNKKLVGLVTATMIDMDIYDKQISMPYVNFLCINSKLRGLNLAPVMIDEIRSRLHKNNVGYAFFTGTKKVTTSFLMTKMLSIPLDYNNLKKVCFIPNDMKEPEVDDEVSPDYNLHLMTKSDIKSVALGLQSHSAKYKIKPIMSEKFVENFMLPKKNIVYSFVRKTN